MLEQDESGDNAPDGDDAPQGDSSGTGAKVKRRAKSEREKRLLTMYRLANEMTPDEWAHLKTLEGKSLEWLALSKQEVVSKVAREAMEAASA